MSRIAPKPIIAQVVQTWRLPAGLTFALVRDIESQAWIVESCPAGTRFWTPEQAAQLPQGRQTGRALQAALRMAKTTTVADAAPEVPDFEYTLPDVVRSLMENTERNTPPSADRVRSAVKTCLPA